MHPNFEFRKLILCELRISDYSLAIETGRYKNIPRNLRLCNKCNKIEDEKHFFFDCKFNEIIRKSFLDHCFAGNVDTLTYLDKLKHILNPSTDKQVKFLGSFIKQSLELRTGGS